ncbi:MAG: hypothetical protein H7Y43_06570, partial [Akkermansiaceae bacterium]|nr:hypothetical protein [Verrucomicrobiales bacterium]
MKIMIHFKPLLLASQMFYQRATRTAGVVGALLLFAGATAIHAQTPLYQWNFDDVSGTGVPSITAGGGTLTPFGAGSFTGVGQSGGATDFTYLGTAAGDGATNALDISGMGTNGHLTVAFWINPSVAYASQPGPTFARFVMMGNSVNYDNNGNSPGFSFSQNGQGLEIGVNRSVTRVVPNVFTPYTAGQWLFVALVYDGTSGSGTNSSALGAAVGNSVANSALVIGTSTSSVGAPTMTPLTLVNNTTSVISPGPITNSPTMVLLVGNRNSNKNRGFIGQIENIHIFTNLLTASQLEALRISGFATTLTAGATKSHNPVIAGNTVLLSAGAAGGTAPYSYQWQADNGSGTFTNIPGATFATHTLTTSESSLGIFQYQVV